MNDDFESNEDTSALDTAPAVEDVEVEEKKTKKKSIPQRIVGWIAIVICVLLIPILIANIVIIVRGSLNPDEIPTAFGYAPMVVVTESMNTGEPDSIKGGDMVVAQKTDVDQLEVGDIIMYQSGQSAVIHRIVDYDAESDSFITQGDANNTTDIDPVSKDNIIGEYILGVPEVGNLVLFSQTPLGMLLCIAVPIVLLLVYDFIAKRLSRRTEKEDHINQNERKGELKNE